MTEAEWLASSNLNLLVRSPILKGRKRKLRLFGCACCRRAWHLLLDERSRNAVDTAERFVDQKATDAELNKARTTAGRAKYPRMDAGLGSAGYYLGVAINEVARTDRAYRPAVVCGFIHTAITEAGGNAETETDAQHQLLRDIFGNPFRPITFDATWRTSDVMLLALGIYDEKAFDRMPILADALQDAGCDNADILKHCRDEKAVGEQGAEAPRTPHVRGCWALDLVLGKS